MKLFGRDLKWPSRKVETRAFDMDDPSTSQELVRLLIGAAQNSTGITVTPLKALGVATVLACVRVRSDAVASLPLEVLKRVGTTPQKAYDHRLFIPLRDNPNSEMTSMDARWSMMANLVLRHTAYAEVLRDSDGDAVGFYPHAYPLIDCIRDGTTKKLVYRHNESGVRYRAEDMLHVKTMTFNGLTGIDALQAVRECIALAIALQDNAAKFFGNGSRPGGVLEHPNSLSTEAQERLRAKFEEQVGGKNLYRLMVLEEGLKYNAIRNSNKDSQFDESRDKQDLNICRIFAVPPHKVGIMSNQPRSNVEQENLSFVIDVVRPDCVRWEQVLNMRLLTQEERDQGYEIKHDLSAILRGDLKSRYESYALGRQWGWLCVDLICDMEGLPRPPSGGDIYLQPLNMADASKATEIQMKNKVDAAGSTPGGALDPASAKK